MFQETITKEELYQLPLEHFEGEVILVQNYEQAVEAANYLKQQRVLGFDTETRPAFKKGQVNKVALLQLGTFKKVFLFRLNLLGLPDCISDILADKNIVKVGVAIRDDIKILKRLNPFKAAGFLELQEYVKEFGIQNFSLKKISGIVLGFRISKSQRLSNWEAQKLTNAQQVYAATDAWVAYEIYKKLINGSEHA
ncbi:3'-5' exonuclease domain-containing protein 2 [Puteibacter caeruleilacunae]|nr:3'-5' exonuclease domain-containing protein 2 [Puteibacter caeruleilacunae]